MLFHQSAAQAMKKSVIVIHFTMTILLTYLYIICNKKILFVKNYLSLLWVFGDFFILLVIFCTQCDKEATNSNSENARCRIVASLRGSLGTGKK
jgi:ABC-type transport system involved in Fe-S cluster assembly fused permease/ATPase subunit